jgi:hypothetical protein
MFISKVYEQKEKLMTTFNQFKFEKTDDQLNTYS